MKNAVEHTSEHIEWLVSVAEGFRTRISHNLEAAETITLPNEDVWRFLVSALQAARSVCSEESPHYKELKECRDSFRQGEPLRLSECIGILRAILDDLQAGMLSEIREIVAAEIFDDLVDMAAYMLEQGYHLPSVAIAGAVLEDTLRKLCRKHSVSWVGDSSINKLNTELYKANVYSKPQFAQIDAWGKLRNKVDHGDFIKADEIDRNDAQRMVNGLRDFITKYLG